MHIRPADLYVTEGVEKAIDAMRPGLPGYEIDTTIFRPASFVEEAIDHLTSSLVLGAFLVVLVLTLFLLDWRAALISVITMPLLRNTSPSAGLPRLTFNGSPWIFSSRSSTSFTEGELPAAG